MDNKRIALVYSAVNIRRYTPGFKLFVSSGVDFRYIDIYRPVTEIFSQLKEWNPDGIITEELPGITSALTAFGKPTVVSPSELSGENYSGVNVDDHLIGELVADELISRGFKNIACYSINAPFAIRRMQGFINKNDAHGIEVYKREDSGFGLRQYMEYTSSIHEEMKKWLEELPKPIGIFAVHDPLGRSLAEACRHFKIAVPEDVAIIAANDDDMICGLSNPPLSSIRIPWNLLAQKTVSILLDMINGQKGKVSEASVIPPLNIITRQSSDIMQIEDRAVGKALQYIRTCAHQDIHVPDIAAYAGISRRQLEQKFKTLLQRTPREEILRIRIDKAKDLLINSNRSMSDIAEICGFKDQERLSVNFKKVEQLSPNQFRKQSRK